MPVSGLWRVLCALVLLFAAQAHGQPQSVPTPDSNNSPEVWLVTIAPGELYWQRFGHNAILLREPATGRAISYNFGYFDFAQQDFLLRFMRGRMLYQAVALDADRDIEGYLLDGRRVWLQRIRVSDIGARQLAAHLETHVHAEHRDYRYDYYQVNCSTKVRDALDLALDGALKRATAHRSHGLTYRLFTRAHAQGLWWLYLGTDIALGQGVDRPLSIWEEAFIPAELMRQMAELRLPDGQSAVLDARQLPSTAAAYTPPEAPDWRAHFAAAGIALAGLLLALSRLAEGGTAARWPLALLGGSLALLMGAAGLLISALWMATDHVAAWRNENLFLLSPFWLLSLPAWWSLLFRAQCSRWAARAARLAGWLAVAGIVLGALAKVFKSFDQSNIEWMLLLWPTVLALRYVLAKHSRARH